jgi:hypothetical protein
MTQDDFSDETIERCRIELPEGGRLSEDEVRAVLTIAEADLAGRMHRDEQKYQTIYPEDTTEDDLISRVGCMFFDAMTVKCVAGDYAKSVIAMVRSHDRARSAFSETKVSSP